MADAVAQLMTKEEHEIGAGPRAWSRKAHLLKTLGWSPAKYEKVYYVNYQSLDKWEFLEVRVLDTKPKWGKLPVEVLLPKGTRNEQRDVSPHHLWPYAGGLAQEGT